MIVVWFTFKYGQAHDILDSLLSQVHFDLLLNGSTKMFAIFSPT